MKLKYRASLKSLAKPFLHAARYPSQALNGVLLGRRHPSESNVVEIIDSVPLFHTRKTLSPITEAALMQISEYCEETGLSIVGYYCANELVFQNTSLHPADVAIANRIGDNFEGAVTFLIDNEKIGGIKELPLRMYTKGSSDWEGGVAAAKDVSVLEDLSLASSGPIISADQVPYRLARLMTPAATESIHDFEQHLDDLSADWLNPHLDSHIVVGKDGE